MRSGTVTRSGMLAAVCVSLLGCAASTSPTPVAPAPVVAEDADAAPKVETEVREPSAPPPAPATKPRTVEPEPDLLELSAEQLARARKIQPLVAKAARTYGVDPNLLNGIIWRESKFNPRARNRSGARGLMQLMPVTGKAMAKKLGRSFRPDDPEFSVEAGALLISINLERFDGDEEMALFAFGRGSGSARKWQREGGPMPTRVTTFIAKVRQAQRTFEQLGFPVVAGRQ